MPRPFSGACIGRSEGDFLGSVPALLGGVRVHTVGDVSLDNHYHTLGYLRDGAALSKMVQRIHGSVAKLVNDLLPERRTEFWRDAKYREYFDGCIRDERKGRLTYRYILRQSERHGVATDWREYPHTRVNVELELAIRRSHELKAFLEGVPYRRYMKGRKAR